MIPVETLEEYRDTFKNGTRVRLIEMSGEPQMPGGLMGTVSHVDDAGQIHVDWENGSTLALIVHADRFEIVETD